IAKDKPIYVQNDRDAALLRSQGFSNLTVMTDATFFGDIQITKTHGGQHGTDRAYVGSGAAQFKNGAWMITGIGDLINTMITAAIAVLFILL
ncbi:hypothetical protein Q0O74_13790, partial [Staphylococcus aureus]|nr:hypothetical protein [Staphylococcus aureus]